jgi:hypothetical protein
MTKPKDEKIRKSHVKNTLDALKEIITKERKCKHIPLSSLELHEVRKHFDVWLIKFASEIALAESKK